jgi:hypothetical protein
MAMRVQRDSVRYQDHTQRRTQRLRCVQQESEACLAWLWHGGTGADVQERSRIPRGTGAGRHQAGLLRVARNGARVADLAERSERFCAPLVSVKGFESPHGNSNTESTGCRFAGRDIGCSGCARRAAAPTPPMGWKSWDCFGTGMTEDEVKKNADYMAANLKGHGLAVHHRGHTVVGTESQIARLPSQCGSEYGRNSSLPMAWRLYLPEVWCQDVERRQPAGVPEEVEFETKPEIALGQIRQAVEEQVPMGVVLADAGYGNGTPFRQALTKLGLQYMVGIDSSTTVWEPGQQPLPAPPRNQVAGRPPNVCSAVRITSRFRRSSWPSPYRFRHGGRSDGAQAAGKPCALVSPLSACARPTAMISGPNHIRKNGS